MVVWQESTEETCAVSWFKMLMIDHADHVHNSWGGHWPAVKFAVVARSPVYEQYTGRSTQEADGYQHFFDSKPKVWGAWNIDQSNKKANMVWWPCSTFWQTLGCEGHFFPLGLLSGRALPGSCISEKNHTKWRLSRPTSYNLKGKF